MPPLTRAGGRRVGDLVGQLPADVLLRIFCRLPKQELQDAAVVCKRWLAVAHEPSGLIRRGVAVDLTRKAAPLQPSFHSWFAERAAFLYSLKLTLPQHNYTAGKAAAAVHAIGGAGVEPQLRDLSVNFSSGTSEAASRLLAALAAEPHVASKLERLVMTHMKGDLKHADLAGALQLPHLKACEICFIDPEEVFGQQEVDWLPDGIPRAFFASSELLSLRIMHAGAASLRQLPQELGQLGSLTSLRLVGCGVKNLWHSLMQVANRWAQDALQLPVSLAPLTRLLLVDITCRRVTLELSTLRNLKSLSLVGLHSPDMQQRLEQLLDSQQLEALVLHWSTMFVLPAAVARQGRLRSLDLRFCRFLETLPSGSYLQSLEHLDLRSSGFQTVPAAVMNTPRLRTLAMLDKQPPLELPQDASLRAATLAHLGEQLQQHCRADGNNVAGRLWRCRCA